MSITAAYFELCVGTFGLFAVSGRNVSPTMQQQQQIQPKDDGKKD